MEVSVDVGKEQAVSACSFLLKVEGNTYDSLSACSSCVLVSLLTP